MKLFLQTLFYSLALVTIANAQTTSTVQSGLWANPATWSCACVPTPGSNVTIDHTVTLTFDYGYSSGSITVGPNGKLTDDVTGRSIWMYGTGSFTNHGTVDLKWLWNQSSAPFVNNDTVLFKSVLNEADLTNSGAFLGLDSLYNSGSLMNNGTFEVHALFNANVMHNTSVITMVDSMTNTGTFLNEAGASIVADSSLNLGDFTNNGMLVKSRFTNTGTFTNNNFFSFDELTNLGDFINADSLVGSMNLWNASLFDNYGGSYISLGNSFYNGDSTGARVTFTNNGRVIIDDSFYNIDSIYGAGYFNVSDSSFNAGVITGGIIFCDLTPLGAIVDYNYGVIGTAVTTNCTVGENNVLRNNFVSYPNPTSGKVYFSESVNDIRIYSFTGQLVLSDRNTKSVDLGHLPVGAYLGIAIDEKGNFSRFKIVKQ